jgi:hypothetical protein
VLAEAKHIQYLRLLIVMGAKKRKSTNGSAKRDQDASDAVWNEFYAQLIEYGLEHDTYQVPLDYEVKTDDGRVLRLGLWLKTQGEKLMEHATKYPHWYNDIADLMETGKLWFDNTPWSITPAPVALSSPEQGAAISPYKLVDTGRSVKDLLVDAGRRAKSADRSETLEDMPAKRLRSITGVAADNSASSSASTAGSRSNIPAHQTVNNGASERSRGAIQHHAKSTALAASSHNRKAMHFSSSSDPGSDSDPAYFPSIARQAGAESSAASIAKKLTPAPAPAKGSKAPSKPLKREAKEAGSSARKGEHYRGRRGSLSSGAASPSPIRKSPIAIAAAARDRASTTTTKPSKDSENEWSDSSMDIASDESSEHSEVIRGKRGVKGRAGKSSSAVASAKKRAAAHSLPKHSSSKDGEAHSHSSSRSGTPTSLTAALSLAPSSKGSSAASRLSSYAAATSAKRSAAAAALTTSPVSAGRSSSSNEADRASKRSLEDAYAALPAHKAAALYSVDGPALVPLPAKEAPPPKGIIRPEQQYTPGKPRPPRRTLWCARPVPPTPPTDLPAPMSNGGPLVSPSSPPRATVAETPDAPTAPQEGSSRIDEARVSSSDGLVNSNGSAPTSAMAPTLHIATATSGVTVPGSSTEPAPTPAPVVQPPAPRRRIKENKLAAAAAASPYADNDPVAGPLSTFADESKDSPRAPSCSSSVGPLPSNGEVEMLEPEDEADLVIVAGRRGGAVNGALRETPDPSQVQVVLTPSVSPAQPKYISPAGETPVQPRASVVSDSASASSDAVPVVTQPTPVKEHQDRPSEQPPQGKSDLEQELVIISTTGANEADNGSFSPRGGSGYATYAVPQRTANHNCEQKHATDLANGANGNGANSANGDVQKPYGTHSAPCASTGIEETEDHDPAPEFVAFAYTRGAETRRPMLGVGMVCNQGDASQGGSLFLLVMAPQSRDLVEADYMMDDRQTVTVSSNMVLGRGLAFEHGKVYFASVELIVFATHAAGSWFRSPWRGPRCFLTAEDPRDPDEVQELASRPQHSLKVLL